MNSPESLKRGLQGSHTVFLLTDYWANGSAAIEFAQGKNATDAAKAVGVSHIIFSSLHHVTEATKGRLAHVPHFGSKANIEKYIRQSGLNATFCASWLLHEQLCPDDAEGRGWQLPAVLSG